MFSNPIFGYKWKWWKAIEFSWYELQARTSVGMLKIMTIKQRRKRQLKRLIRILLFSLFIANHCFAKEGNSQTHIVDTLFEIEFYSDQFKLCFDYDNNNIHVDNWAISRSFDTVENKHMISLYSYNEMANKYEKNNSFGSTMSPDSITFNPCHKLVVGGIKNDFEKYMKTDSTQVLYETKVRNNNIIVYRDTLNLSFYLEFKIGSDSTVYFLGNLANSLFMADATILGSDMLLIEKFYSAGVNGKYEYVVLKF